MRDSVKISERRNFSYLQLCFILTCMVGLGALIDGHAHGALSQIGPGGQDNNAEARHRYVMESGWNGCGGIPYSGWEGCISQTGIRLRCDDGARLYFVKDNCTSSFAANNKWLFQFEKGYPATQDWKIVQTEPMADALLVELASPVRVNSEEPASSKWVCSWIKESSVVLIYGPDREHVIDYFKVCQKDENKPKGASGT